MDQEPFKALSGRRSIPTSYRTATILYAGGACFFYLLCVFFDSLTEWNQPPLIPGLGDVRSLFFPALYFWGGIMLRERFRNPSTWILIVASLIIALAAVFYLDINQKSVNSHYLFLAMLCIGFLIPSYVVDLAQKNRGGLSLTMAFVAVFCYTAISVVKHRFLLISLGSEQADMYRLIFWLLAYSRALLAVLSSCLLMQFAFSEVGQNVGKNITIKWVAIISCILTFLMSVKFVIITPFTVMWGYEHCIPLMCLIIQPAFIFLIGWCANKVRTKKTDNR